MFLLKVINGTFERNFHYTTVQFYVICKQTKIKKLSFHRNMQRVDEVFDLCTAENNLKNISRYSVVSFSALRHRSSNYWIPK